MSSIARLHLESQPFKHASGFKNIVRLREIKIWIHVSTRSRNVYSEKQYSDSSLWKFACLYFYIRSLIINTSVIIIWYTVIFV